MKYSFSMVLLGTLLIISLGAAPVKQSYSMERYEDASDPVLMHCTLCMMVNGESVGTIRYTISLKPEKVSYVSYLLVYNQYRKYGYGKVLLYHALSDLRSHGVSVIELDRAPFYLDEGDSLDTRDEQLRQFYKRFGFTDVAGKQKCMILKSPEIFDNLFIKPQFGGDRIKFLLEQHKKIS